MTGPQCMRENRDVRDKVARDKVARDGVALDRDGFGAICIAIYFVISLNLTCLFYWISWQGWAATEWPWHLTAFCAPFPASVWLGTSALSLPPRRSALLGLVAGAIGFLLHLLIYSSYKGQLLPPTWPLSLSAFVLAGALLGPSGYAIGCRLTGSPAHDKSGGAANSSRGDTRAHTRPAYWVYIQTVLGFLGPIIVAIIDRHK